MKALTMKKKRKNGNEILSNCFLRTKILFFATENVSLSHRFSQNVFLFNGKPSILCASMIVICNEVIRILPVKTGISSFNTQ